MHPNLEKISALSIPLITVIAITLVFVEWMLLLIQRKVARNKEGWISVISAGLAFTPVFVLTKIWLLALMFWLYQYSLFQFGFQWYIWLLAWVVYDFLFWLIHLLSHKVRVLWCVHNVHHSAKEMKLSVAFRGSLFDFLVIPHNIVWLPLLGFHPFMVLVVDAVGKFYGIIVHINENWFPNKKRTWVDEVIVTPSAHRVHHATNHIYLDRNYGETLSIWDRIFGTYQVELTAELPVYGVLKEVNSENLLETQTGEWKALWSDIKTANKLTDKLKYLFMPPGWNHVDGGILAHELRQKALKDLNGTKQ